MIKSGKRTCTGWPVSKNLTEPTATPWAARVDETPELSCDCISSLFPLASPCKPWFRLCLLQQQRKCLQKPPYAAAAGGCDRCSQGWGMSAEQCRALCAIIVLCCKLEATERRTRQPVLWNGPPGTGMNLPCCRVCTIVKTGNLLREDSDKIPHLNLVSISSTFTEIIQQWSAFKLCFKKTSKDMKEEDVNFQGKCRVCWKRKQCGDGPGSVLLSLTLLGTVKPLKSSRPMCHGQLGCVCERGSSQVPSLGLGSEQRSGTSACHRHHRRWLWNDHQHF